MRAPSRARCRYLPDASLPLPSLLGRMEREGDDVREEGGGGWGVREKERERI